MQLSITKLAILVAMFMSLVSISAKADYKSSIIESCTAYQQGQDNDEVNACKLYIDGFIDSSLLAEEGAVKINGTLQSVEKPQSEFIKRVYQTRLLTRNTLADEEMTYQFCIPRELNRKIIASNIAKALDIKKLENELLKVVVFEALTNKYPCSAM